MTPNSGTAGEQKWSVAPCRPRLPNRTIADIGTMLRPLVPTRAGVLMVLLVWNTMPAC
jgi:hypothetical protein